MANSKHVPTAAPVSALVIFGASGDLTTRKLMPALEELESRGFLSDRFTVVGVARTEQDDAAFRKRMFESVPNAQSSWRTLTDRFRIVTGDFSSHDTYVRLGQTLAECDVAAGLVAGTGNRVFYLAAPPSTFATIVSGLSEAGLNRPVDPQGFSRIVVEKPFGVDLASARQLDTDIHQAFAEDQVYRIDHYLGKETVQNVLALRFANAIFEPLWNRTYVDYLEITVAEELGVGHRGGFYEQAGALRDIVQNHVMQVLSLMLMEAPATMDADGIRDEKVKALRSIVSLDPSHLERSVVRAQYQEGLAEGEKVIRYRDEQGVNPESQTETFVAMTLHCDNWRWAGVPIYVRTGKRLPKRITEVAMHFRAAPHLAFGAKLAKRLEPNSLIMRIQPDAGIELRFGAKVPGQSFEVRTAHMDFSYDTQFSEEDLDGYERLLLDVLQGDPTLFIRSDEVHEAWRIVEPVLQGFANDDVPLASYPSGTWGPREGDRLVETDGHRWRTP